MNLDSLRLWVALFLILFAGSCVLKTHHHLVTFREAHKTAEHSQSQEKAHPSVKSSHNEEKER
jgi:hypothetical protein